MASPTLFKKLSRVYYGWWIVASNSIISFVGGFHFNGGSVYFLPISESLSLSRAQLSFVFAAARLEGGVEGPLVGWLVDRIGTRKLIFFGGIFAGLGYILLGTIVHNFTVLFLVYVLLISTGASTGFFAPLMAAVNIWFARKRTIALSIVNSFSRGSAFIVTPLLSFLVLTFGWERASLIAGVSIMVVVCPAALVHRRSPESMGLRPDGDSVGSPGPAQRAARGHTGRYAGRSQVDFTTREALKTRAFWIMTIAQALRIMVQGGLFVHMIAILVWKGLERQEAANLLGLMAIAGVPAVLLFGWAGDRFNKNIVIAFGAIAGVLGLVILGISDKTWHLIPYVFFMGIADASFPVIVSLSGDYFGRRSFATLRGISQFFTAFGVFVTTIFAGWVWDKTGSYTAAILPLTGAAALAVPLFLILKPPKLPQRAGAAAVVAPVAGSADRPPPAGA